MARKPILTTQQSPPEEQCSISGIANPTAEAV